MRDIVLGLANWLDRVRVNPNLTQPKLSQLEPQPEQNSGQPEQNLGLTQSQPEFNILKSLKKLYGEISGYVGPPELDLI